MYSEGICVLIALERHGISSLYPTNRRKGGGLTETDIFEKIQDTVLFVWIMIIMSRKVVENVKPPVIISVCECVFLCLKPIDLLPSSRAIKTIPFPEHSRPHLWRTICSFQLLRDVKSGRSGEVPPINLS